ncbi:hypothetical protein NKJ71_12855, partial [Mesorhizobium sp. M0050]|uniref:hypothetical protein n=1 Tax=Mesorhizobium sp. M0050 TaxID=2956861 RepID=UPI003337C1EB
ELMDVSQGGSRAGCNENGRRRSGRLPDQGSARKARAVAVDSTIAGKLWNVVAAPTVRELNAEAACAAKVGV